MNEEAIEPLTVIIPDKEEVGEHTLERNKQAALNINSFDL